MDQNKKVSNSLRIFGFSPVTGFPKYCINKVGIIWSFYRNKFIKPTKQSGGYFHLGIKNDLGIKFKYLHTLILEAWVGPRPEGMVCCHNNGVPSDNRLDNLRWDTPEANLRDAFQHKTMGGENNYNSRLTEKEVIQIRERYKRGDIFQEKLAQEFGVSQVHISRIVHKTKWK